MTADEFVARLEKARRMAPGRWVAACPAHEDKTPSMTVRELSDGRILVHCFAGCGIGAITDAIGISVSDLFPEKSIDYAAPLRKPFPAEDVLAALGLEIQIVIIVADDVAEGRQVTSADMQRLRLARNRLDEARRMALGER